MSITGLCQICEEREADHSCPNCGTLVCEVHWDEVTGLCVQCAAAVDRGERDKGRTTPDDLDDEDVTRF